MTNKNAESLTLTPTNGNRQFSHTFQPGAIILRKYSNADKYYIESFKLNGTVFYYANAHVHKNVIADAIKNNATSVLKSVGSLFGPEGALAGQIAGYTVAQIAKQFPDTIHSNGYYANEVYYYEGPLPW